MRLFLLAIAALAVAGCDLPTDPVPTNPYDPLFEGARIPTGPTDLALVGSTPTSIDLSWTDQSSFESGVRVQLQTGAGSRTIATLPPDATSYTDTDVESTADRSYTVVAIAEGGRESTPSNTLRVRFTRERLGVDALRAVTSTVTEARFSDDGETLFARSGGGIWAVDTRSGTLLGELVPSGWIARADRRGFTSVVTPIQGGRVLLATFQRATRGGTVTLEPGFECRTPVSQSLRTDDDGRAAGLCLGATGEATAFASWGLPGGLPRRTTALAVTRALVFALSPDGTRAVVGAVSPGGFGRDLIGLNVETGAVEWTVRENQGADFELTFSPDSRQIFDASPSRVRLRSAATGAVVASAAGRVARASAVSFAPDGQTLAVLYDALDEVAIFDVPSLAPRFRLAPQDVIGAGLLDERRAVVFRVLGSSFAIERYDFTSTWERLDP